MVTGVDGVWKVSRRTHELPEARIVLTVSELRGYMAAMYGKHHGPLYRHVVARVNTSYAEANLSMVQTTIYRVH